MSCFRVSKFQSITPLTVREAIAEATSLKDPDDRLFWTHAEAREFVQLHHAAQVELAERALRVAKAIQAHAAYISDAVREADQACRARSEIADEG